MGLIKSIVEGVKDLLGTVLGKAVEWVYKGTAWALGLFMPKKKAEKVARVLVTGATVAGTAYLLWLGAKFLFPGSAAPASSFVKDLLGATLAVPLLGPTLPGLALVVSGVSSVRLVSRVSWLKKTFQWAYWLSAIPTVYGAGAFAWERSR